MITARIRPGGRFLKEIRARRQDFEKQPRMRARITVPVDLRWWYWLEFGTAARAEDGRGSGHTYAIRPKNADYLVWVSEEGKQVRRVVEHHPGIAPRHAVLKVLPDILQQAIKDLHAAVLTGPIRTATIMQTLVGNTMHFAKGAIAKSLELNTSPTIPRKGRLPDGSAADEFNEKAVIETVGL